MKVDPTAAPALMTMEEVSEEYRVPVATLRFWRHKGTGPASFKIGRRVMYRREDVQAWLQEQIEAQGVA